MFEDYRLPVDDYFAAASFHIAPSGIRLALTSTPRTIIQAASSLGSALSSPASSTPPFLIEHPGSALQQLPDFYSYSWAKYPAREYPKLMVTPIPCHQSPPRAIVAPTP